MLGCLGLAETGSDVGRCFAAVLGLSMQVGSWCSESLLLLKNCSCHLPLVGEQFAIVIVAATIHNYFENDHFDFDFR